MKKCLLLFAAALAVGLGQYSRQFQSPNLGTGAYGGSFGYDLDDDGFPNLWTRSSAGQMTVYNSSLVAFWTVTFSGYEYSYLATPRDVDGDGLVKPVNMDADPAGEVVFSGAHYATDGYTGKIRVYDGSSRQLEWESAVIDGFTGYAYVDDVDGDGRHEIIITRADYTNNWGYIEVYGYSGAGAGEKPGYELRSRQVTAEPSVSSGTVEFALAAEGRTRLVIFDAAGREVRELVNSTLPAGEYRMRWDGCDGNGARLAAGVYVYRLESPAGAESGQVVLAE